MPFLYDLLHPPAAPEQPGTPNVADGTDPTFWGGTGLRPDPTPRATMEFRPTPPGQAAQGGSVNQAGFLDFLKRLAQSQGGGQQPAPTMAPAGRPPTATQPMPASSAGSHQGFLTGSSRGGFDLGDLMKVAAIVGTMGAGAGAAGAMGGGASMGGGAAAGGAGGGAMGGLGGMGGGGGGGGFLSGLMGGGGGGGKSADATPVQNYPQLPQAGPLVAQNNNPYAYWG